MKQTLAILITLIIGLAFFGCESNATGNNGDASQIMFVYAQHDSYYWDEEGDIFWQDGADGEDICFELSCLSIGPGFYAWDCAFSRTTLKMESEMEKIESAEFEIDNTSPSFEFESINLVSLLNSVPNSEMAKEFGVKGIYRFEHYYKQVK